MKKVDYKGQSIAQLRTRLKQNPVKSQQHKSLSQLDDSYDEGELKLDLDNKWNYSYMATLNIGEPS